MSKVWDDVYGDELGWLTTGETPGYQDKYHEHAVYLLARIDDTAVGCMRLVIDSPVGLPVEQFASVNELRVDKRLIECQRLMIRDRYRNQRTAELPYGVFGGLVKACVHWCIFSGYTHIVADTFTSTRTTPIAPLLAIGFQHTGIEFVDTELSGPGHSIALLLRVGELFSRSFRCSSGFYQYLMAPDDAIDVYSSVDHTTDQLRQAAVMAL